jgi:hypothetical protein
MQAPASLRQSVGIETRDLTGETGVFTLLAIVIMTWIVLRRSAISSKIILWRKVSRRSHVHSDKISFHTI